MWTQIIRGNRSAIANLLIEMRAGIDRMLAGVSGERADQLTRSLAAGVAGTERIPGKHGTPPTDLTVITAVLPDRPGQLATLFADLGNAQINVEDLRMAHNPGVPVGYVELSVRPDIGDLTVATLTEHGWQCYVGTAGQD